MDEHSQGCKACGKITVEGHTETVYTIRVVGPQRGESAPTRGKGASHYTDPREQHIFICSGCRGARTRYWGLAMLLASLGMVAIALLGFDTLNPIAWTNPYLGTLLLLFLSVLMIFAVGILAGFVFAALRRFVNVPPGAAEIAIAGRRHDNPDQSTRFKTISAKEFKGIVQVNPSPGS